MLINPQSSQLGLWNNFVLGLFSKWPEQRERFQGYFLYSFRSGFELHEQCCDVLSVGNWALEIVFDHPEEAFYVEV